MAIQTINLAVPGGDTPFNANTKINANFSDQTNAASRLVGTATGQIPLAQDAYKAAHKNTERYITGASEDCNSLGQGTRLAVSSSVTNSPTTSFGDNLWVVETKGSYMSGDADRQQIAIGFTEPIIVIRSKVSAGWSDWRVVGTSAITYSTTTASGANVVVDTTGKLMRSTSSERYKDILAPLELDDARYADAMALKPIVYRSTADADNPAYHYYSFSAEELGAYDPAFTLWRDTETVTDADGNVTEQPLAERQAEGININALLAMGHAIAIKQGELIKDLQEQVIEQKEAIAALKQTNP